MLLVTKHIRFGKHNLSNTISDFGFSLESIEDSMEVMNSHLSSEYVLRSGPASGEFNVATEKEKKILNAVYENYDGDTFNKDSHMFPAILTKTVKETGKVYSTDIFVNATCQKTQDNVPDNKKNHTNATYSWKAQDHYTITRPNYVYVDEFEATAQEDVVDLTYKLNRNLATDTTPILYCLVNYVHQPAYNYEVTGDAETGYSLVLKTGVDHDLEIKAGDKILVVYETDSNEIL